MKGFMKTFGLGLLIVFGMFGQSPSAPTTLQIAEQPLPPVTLLSVVPTTVAGTDSYCYGVVTRYGVGNSQMSPLHCVSKIGAGSSIAVSWQAPASPTVTALTYDVIRLINTTTFPSSGICTNCLLASATSSVSTTDTLAALSGYTLNGYALNTVTLSLDNINSSTVTITGILAGANINPPSSTGDLIANVNGIVKGDSRLKDDGDTFIFNLNTAIPPAPPHLNSFQIIGADTQSTGQYIDTYGTAARGFINLRHATGTLANPTASTIGQEMGRIAGRGYCIGVHPNCFNGNGFTGSLSALSFIIAENTTGTAQGSYAIMRTPAFGSVGGGTLTAPPETVRFQPSGGVSIGDVTFNATDPGKGYLALQKYLQSPLTTPASSSDVCVVNTFEFDAGFLYVCTATNTWKRAALSTF